MGGEGGGEGERGGGKGDEGGGEKEGGDEGEVELDKSSFV